MSPEIGFKITVPLPYDLAQEKVITALKTEGFGVLTRIDVKATLQEKLGEEFRPYMILGACNPPLAHRALSQDSSVGLMLPCNVTLEQNADGSSTINIANPKLMLVISTMQDNPVLQEVADDAYARLKRVAHSLSIE
jgi:uncharacterized protein (DUF302 family)